VDVKTIGKPNKLADDIKMALEAFADGEVAQKGRGVQVLFDGDSDHDSTVVFTIPGDYNTVDTFTVSNVSD
jgi:hypothetical protein